MVRTFLSSLVLALATAGAWAAAPVYKIELIRQQGDLRPKSGDVVNNQGVVAGLAAIGSGESFVPYRYADKTVAPATEPLGHVIVDDMNDGGDILGRVINDSFIWLADGSSQAVALVSASSLNDQRQVVGHHWFDGKPHAALLTDGQIADLGTLGGDTSYGYDLNDLGQVTGAADLPNGDYHAFVWRDGQMTDLGAPGGGKTSFGAAINNRGHVAGVGYDKHNKTRAFVHDGTTMKLLPAEASGANYIYLSGMNEQDEVVGASGSGPLLYTGGKSYLLRNLLNASGGEWEELLYANSINDAGQITGVGRRQGRLRAYIATRVK